MSFPAYPDYKDSEVSWLGAVPSHWEVTRLKVECDVFPSNVDKKSAVDEQVVKLCNYTDVYYNDLITAEMPFMEATASEEQIAKFTLRAGDTIITKDSETPDDIARSAYVLTDLPGVVCGYHLSMIRPKHRAHGAFIKRYFDTAPSRAYFHVSANGLTRVGLGQYALDNAPIALPPVGEQTAIADFLDRETAKIDALVAEQERLIALLKEKRQAVISHAVTKGLNPETPMKDSGVEWLGKIPAHWEILPFGWLFKFVKRQNGKIGAVLSVYREFGVIEKSSREDNNNKTPDDLSSYQEVLVGDLVINKMKSWQGSLGVSDFTGITSPDYAVFEPCHDCDPKFINQLLRSKNLPDVFRSISNGIRSDQWRLEPQKLKSLRLPIPPRAEQTAIASSLDKTIASFSKLTFEAQSAIGLLQERRAALISAAVTGKIDVRGAFSENNVVPISSAREQQNWSSLRAVVGAYAIRELGAMGRMAVMKAGYLAEAHAGFSDLAGRYERNAAGPYDQSLIAAMERGAGELCAIQTIEPQAAGLAVFYKVPNGYQAPSEVLEALAGDDRAMAFVSMLAFLKGIGRDGVEAVATLYAVWNDLIAAGKTVDDDTVCNGVLNDWHDEKRQKFKHADLDHWLDWMRRNDIVPNGSAPRTDHQGSLFA